MNPITTRTILSYICATCRYSQENQWGLCTIQDVAIALPADPSQWPKSHDFMIVQVMSIALDPVAIECPQIQSILIVQSFLDDLCSLDIQGSQPIPKSTGNMPINHTVGYNMSACREVVQSMINANECLMYLGVVSQIDNVPSEGAH